MNFFKRAMLSSKSRLSKTMILFAVMLAVCTVILASISIQSATNQASILARQKLGAEVSLQVDMNKVMEQTKLEMDENISGEKKPFDKQSMKMQPITLDYIEELSASEYIENISLTTTATADSELLAVGADEQELETNELEDETTGMMQPMGGKVPGVSKIGSGDFNISGVNDLTLSSDYQAGYIDLIDGRLLTNEDVDKNVVIIEEALAEQNELIVGDIFTVTTGSEEDSNLISVNLEVVGIYTTSAPYNEMASMVLSTSPYNKMYVPYTVASELKGEEYMGTVDSVVFHLTDPIYVEDFIEEAESNSSIDFNLFSLTQLGGDYEAMMGPIENVASFSQTTLVLMIVFGGLILTLIIMLSIKDRMNEIGILLSLGEHKSKVILQLLTEVLIVLVLALGVSSVVGESVSEIISDQLIANELSVTEDGAVPGIPGGNRGGSMGSKLPFNMNEKNVGQTEVIEELDINVTVEQFAQLSVIGVLISILATILPAAFIMRLQPKAILSQHN